MCTNPPGYMQVYVARERQKIIALLGGVCSVCKGRDNLEIHHKNGKLMEIQCYDCHKEYHMIHGR